MPAKCRRRYCSAVMEPTTDGLGHVAFRCHLCARNRAGLCRDCPARLADPRAFRCETCRVRHALDRDRGNKAQRRRDPGLQAKIIRKRREYNHRPDIVARRKVTQAAYRAAHPRVTDEAERLYQHVWAQTNRRNDAYRRRRNKRDRARRRRDPEYRARMNAESKARYHRRKERAREQRPSVDVIAIHSVIHSIDHRGHESTLHRTTFKRRTA